MIEADVAPDVRSTELAGILHKIRPLAPDVAKRLADVPPLTEGGHGQELDYPIALARDLRHADANELTTWINGNTHNGATILPKCTSHTFAGFNADGTVVGR
jgi:hypothetical protein